MDKETLKRRLKAAEDLDRRLKAIWESLDKVPSYTGKAPFMDKIDTASKRAFLLADNLKLDLAGFDSN